jgi:acetyl-CoA carboxylase carboxyl transferase subunit alpha
MVYLEFEQPLESLYDQLEQIKAIEAQGDVDVSAAIKDLELKIVNLKRDLQQPQRLAKGQLSRHPERPYTPFLYQQIFSHFVELHGDRLAHDDKAIIGGFAQLNGKSMMVIGHQKGANTKMRQYRNFGMAQSRRLSQSTSAHEISREIQYSGRHFY